MAIAPFSFTGVQPNPDQTYQSGLNQYMQQGQSMIDPGRAQVAASNPINAAGIANLAKAFQQQVPQLPAQMPTGIAQQAMAQGAMQNPNVGWQNMGGVGPTPQNLALAQGLMQQQPQQNPYQQLVSGGNG